MLFVVVVLGVVLWAPLTTTVPEPAFDGPARDWLAYARATEGQALPGSPVGMVGIFGFVVFAVCLAVKLAPSGERTSVPSILVVVAAGLMTALWMADEALTLASAFRARDLDVSTASLMYGLGNGFFAASWFAIAGLLFAAGLGALASRALPRWLGWSGLVSGVGYFVAACVPLTNLWFIPYALFYFWVVAVSIVLLRSALSPST
jgi:hypothetical protein